MAETSTATSWALKINRFLRKSFKQSRFLKWKNNYCIQDVLDSMQHLFRTA